MLELEACDGCQLAASGHNCKLIASELYRVNLSTYFGLFDLGLFKPLSSTLSN